MSINEQAVDVIAIAIKDAVSEYLKSAPFDVTKSGVVAEVLPNNNYSVRIQGAVYTVPSATSDIYVKDNIVLVLFAQNDERRKYIIGKVG